MPTIALIAHDAKKDDLLELVLERRAQLTAFTIVATNTTGTLIEKAGLEVRKMLSGPLGGDLQIGALTATGGIDAMIFLRDPLTAHPHEPDIAALMKVCDIHNVPLATNIATAKILLDGCQPDK